MRALLVYGQASQPDGWIFHDSLLVGSRTRYRPSLFPVQGTKAHTIGLADAQQKGVQEALPTSDLPQPKC